MMKKKIFVISISALWLLPALIVNRPVEANEKIIHMRGDSNYPPFEYLNEKGKPAGFNVDIVRAVAQVMNIKIILRLGPWNEVRHDLETGKIDALAGMYKTEERDKRVDFTIPHLIVSYAIFVRKDSDIGDITDISGRRIIVQKDDLGHDYIKEKGYTGHIIVKQNWTDTLKSLSHGEGDCAIVSRLQGLRLIKKLKLKNLKAVGSPIIQRQYCIAVGEGNHRLLATLNEGLSLIKTTGHYEKIYNRWFGVYEKKSFSRIIKYLSIIILVLFFFAGAFILWSWTLKKRVNVRTKELRESEEKFRIIAEQTRLGIAIIQDERLKFANQALADIFLYSVDEMLQWGKIPFEKLIHADSLKSVRRKVIHRQTEEKGNNFEIRITTASQQVKWVDVHTRTALFENRPAELVAMSDITEKKINQQLMIQSEKMISLGGLAAGMAHEINNPLGIITQSLQNAMRRLRTDKEKNKQIAEECDTTIEGINCYLEKTKIYKYFSGINEAVDRAAAIISTMLQFSQQTDSDSSKININIVIDDILRLLSHDHDFQQKYDYSEIKITTTYHPSLPLLLCSRFEIEQVILNLLKNAAQAIHQNPACNKPEIRITTDVDKNNIIIKIEDNGHGIEGDELKYIFEPFYTTKPVGSGTGLGLSIAYYIVTRNNGGDIMVTSKKGRGTTFTILLPGDRENEENR